MNFKISDKMRETYIQHRSQDLECLKDSFNKNSIEEFHRVGHQLVGNARTFGFEELEAIGEKMEVLSQADLGHTGAKLLNDFKTWLELIEIHIVPPF